MKDFKKSAHWKDDIIAGFIVFLIALPLSIGIALAAGAPASAGILSAVLGGIIGTLITGTHITISGPAAGLIVVIGGSIVSLADGGDLLLGFKRTLAATMIAGILQILVGVFRLGKLTFLAPISVVHGMLAAIGTIIMVKQLPVLLGVEANAKSIIGVLGNTPEMLVNTDVPILIISTIGFIILICWKYLPGKFSKLIPGPLVVVASGLGLSYFLSIEYPHDLNWFNHQYHVGPEFLVHVPESIRDLFIFPQFDIIFSSRSIASILTIFLVGTLESLLSAYAVDKLDPYKRKSNLDFDIIGKGMTNIFCGALGAYPIITEIVRSSANISNGAKTKWANFFHGLFILFFVSLVPGIINHIPLASLAAILFLVGFNLAHPKHFKEVYHHGPEQLAFFCTTLIVTLVEDLLVGIAAGIIVKLLYELVVSKIKFSEIFFPKIEIVEDSGETTLYVNSPVIFLGYIHLSKTLSQLNLNKPLLIQQNNFFIDFTINEVLKDYNSQITGQGAHSEK